MKALLIAFEAAEVSQSIGFLRALGCSHDVLCLGTAQVPATGAEKVLSANLTTLPASDALAAGLAELAAQYDIIAALSSMESKDVLARLAGMCDLPMVTDVVHVNSPSEFRRPIVAGALIETVQVNSPKVLVTFRASGFDKIAPEGTVNADSISLNCSGKTEVLQRSAKSGGRPDLTQAKVIISGGRPLKDAATFERVIGGFADAVGGATGATRAAVDSGIAPNELQVGQTGKIVAPDLYIAAGISGSTQHMAGIKDSKVIVAINTDPDAPIFEVADIGLVQDLFVALPELQSKIKR